MKGKKIIGLTLITVSIVALITWEKWGKNQFLYDDAIVLNQNIDKGTLITEEMLERKKIDTDEGDLLKKGQEQYIIGMEAVQFIHKGVPVFQEYFQEEKLTVDKERDEYILSVPDDWIMSKPYSIMRGSEAFFYCNGEFVTSANVMSVNAEEKSFEVIVDSKQSENFNKLVNQGDKFVVTCN